MDSRRVPTHRSLQTGSQQSGFKRRCPQPNLSCSHPPRGLSRHSPSATASGDHAHRFPQATLCHPSSQRTGRTLGESHPPEAAAAGHLGARWCFAAWPFGAKVQCLGLAHTDQQEKNKLAKTLL